MMAQAYEFKRYPIFECKINNSKYDVKPNLSHFNDAEKEIANIIIEKFDRIVTKTVIYPDLLKAIGDYDGKLFTDLAPPLLDIEKDAKFVTMGLEQHRFSFSFYSKDRKTNGFKSHFLMLVREMIYSFKFWDDRFMFRFYAMNEFINSLEDNKMTLGDYLAKDEPKLREKFRHGKGKKTKYTENLLRHYISDGHFLRFNVNEPEKESTLIMGLTKHELIGIVDKANDFFPKATGKNKSKTTERIIATIKDSEKDVSNYMVTEKVEHIINKSLSVHNLSISLFGGHMKTKFVDLSTTYFGYIESMDSKMRMKILEKLETIIDDVSTVDLLAFILVMGRTKYFFNRAKLDKAYEVLYAGLTSMEVEPKVFVEFVAETVLTYDYELPTHSDWELFIKNGDSLSEQIPASLAIPLMLNKDRGQKRSLVELERNRLFLQKVRNMITN